VEEWIKHPITRRNHVFMMLVGVMAMIMAGVAAVITMPTVKGSFKSALIATGILALGYLIFSLMKPSSEKPEKTRCWRFLFVIWLMIDLFWAGWKLNPAVDSSLYVTSPVSASPSRYYLTQSAERDLRFKRFFNFEDIRETGDWKNLVSSNLPNINILTSTPIVNNFDPMVPDRYLAFMNELETAKQPVRNRLLALAGAGQAGSVSSTKPYSITWQPVDAFPREWITGCAQIALNDTEALYWLKIAADENLLGTSIVVEETREKHNNCIDLSEIKPDIVSSVSPNHRSYTVTGNPTDDYMFMAETWYPGWVAYVDGKETPVLRADYVFMAVELPAGDHTVKIEYRPVSFSAGALLTLAGIMICAILGFRKRASSGGSH
jgi:hypothetical protein